MYCPNCGTKTSAVQKFCRSCGLGLEKVAQSLAEQLPVQLDDSLQARKDKLERLGVLALSVFGLGILGLILYGIVYRVILIQGRTWEGIGLLSFIVILSSGLLAVYLFAEANEASAKRQIKQSKELPEDEMTKKLLPEAQAEPVPSVTERTTERLFVEKKGSAQGS